MGWLIFIVEIVERVRMVTFFLLWAKADVDNKTAHSTTIVFCSIIVSRVSRESRENKT